MNCRCKRIGISINCGTVFPPQNQVTYSVLSWHWQPKSDRWFWGEIQFCVWTYSPSL